MNNFSLPEIKVDEDFDFAWDDVSESRYIFKSLQLEALPAEAGLMAAFFNFWVFIHDQRSPKKV